MKKCPNCQKTYDDNLKFCQADGTPLVSVAEDVPEENPFKTTVGTKADVPAPPAEETPKPGVEADPFATMVAPVVPPKPEVTKEEDDVLEVPLEPEADPMQTMVVSGDTAGKIEIDVPEDTEAPKAEPPETPGAGILEEKVAVEPAPSPPAPPKFEEPEVPTPAVIAGSPPETPKSKPDPPSAPPHVPVSKEPDVSSGEAKRPSPIPSPFDESMPPGFTLPENPPFEPPSAPVEPVQMAEPSSEEPARERVGMEGTFDEARRADAGVDVQGALASSDQGSQIDLSDAAVAASTGEGQNQTMAYISLGLGGLSVLCCPMGILLGPAGAITGYLAKGKIKEDPNTYGGSTFATIGMITGIVGTVLWFILFVLNVFLSIGTGF